ncbi:MAG: metallophosphoesterase [Clostridia bacterium]|nr:metallophosphoesterase [Clostridia bacterium]
MKRIVVFSDTHRNIDNSLKVLENLIGVDMVIHLGDHIKDAEELSYIYPDLEFIKIRGNNDFEFSTPLETVVEIDGVRIFCCHGHVYSKKSLFKIAEDENCSIILCGHTHISEIVTENKITLLNPGSISRPRDSHCSYGVIEIENGKFGLDIIKGVRI